MVAAVATLRLHSALTRVARRHASVHARCSPAAHINHLRIGAALAPTARHTHVVRWLARAIVGRFARKPQRRHAQRRQRLRAAHDSAGVTRAIACCRTVVCALAFPRRFAHSTHARLCRCSIACDCSVTHARTQPTTFC